MKKSTKKKPKLPKFEYGNTYNAADPNRQQQNDYINYGVQTLKAGADIYNTQKQPDTAVTNPPQRDYKSGFLPSVHDAGLSVADYVTGLINPNIIKSTDYQTKTGATTLNQGVRGGSNISAAVGGDIVNYYVPGLGTAINQGRNTGINASGVNDPNSKNYDAGLNKKDNQTQDIAANLIGSYNAKNNKKSSSDNSTADGSTDYNSNNMTYARNGGKMPKLMKYQDGGHTQEKLDKRKSLNKDIYNNNHNLDSLNDLMIQSKKTKLLENIYNISNKGDTLGLDNINKYFYFMNRIKNDTVNYPDYNQNIEYNPHNYEQGGTNNGNENAELEKQEVFQTPDGSIDNVNGNSHEQGGVPVNLPEQTKILSDKLKMPGTKKTFAKLAKPLNTAKEEKIIDNPDKSNLAKSTAQLMIQAKNAKMNQLFNIQEGLKKSKVVEYAKKLGVNINSLVKQDEPEQIDNSNEEQQEHRYGGTQLPKFTKGSLFDPNYNEKGEYIGVGSTQYRIENDDNGFNSYISPGQPLEEQNGYGVNSVTKPYNKEVTVINPNISYENGKEYELNPNQKVRDPYYNTAIINPNSLNPKINPYKDKTEQQHNKELWNKLHPNGTTGGPTPKYDYTNDIGNTIAGVSNLAGPVYGLMTNKKEATVMPHLLNPKYLNATEQLKNERENYLMNKNDIKEVGQGNTSQIMSNYIRNKSKSTMDRALIKENIDNANAQIYNRADEGNTAQRVYADDINRRNEAMYRNINTKYIGDVGTTMAGNWKDQKQTMQDQKSLAMIAAMYPDYTYKNGVWVHKVYGTNLNDDIRQGKVTSKQ